MVTIEEKIRLFTELVYQKIEKENKEEIERFNERFKNLIEEKKRDFEEEFNRVREERIKRLTKRHKGLYQRQNMRRKEYFLKKG
ncbi:hypothetical protein [Caloramator sp. Dgby_cultured_2]|uniref:hypothetical protein n=1 Tax=Caloramator sp. Dgby_cultured_2 TaxID=3029174 RepID=UPI00237DA79D|nr:hypothetical protein [Caloramator sp. Dgby_cultured_2]WDU82231.1 hypothetical protein PWK10_11015 [Caloramator sp. Dgby_cultured_2]